MIKKLFEKGKKEVGALNKRDRFIAGTALYLGDGYKQIKVLGLLIPTRRLLSL